MAILEAPNIIKGPLTLEGRRQATETALVRITDDFIAKAALRRYRDPWDMVHLDEVEAQRGKMSPQSVDILEGYMGIENEIPFFAEAGFEGLRNSPARIRLHDQWVKDETRHGITFERMLNALGVRDHEQTRAYNEKVLEKPWSIDQHKGANNMIGASIFGAEQEGDTYCNYDRYGSRIRQEFGLEEAVTQEEKARGQLYGVLEALRLVKMEEGTHRGLYINTTMVYLRYFPDETVVRMLEVYENFRMPALRLIPNRHHFLRALIETGVYSEAIHNQQVYLPTLKMLGFDSEDHLREVAAGIKDREMYDTLEPITT
jgi:hypothetical protein